MLKMQVRCPWGSFSVSPLPFANSLTSVMNYGSTLSFSPAKLDSQFLTTGDLPTNILAGQIRRSARGSTKRDIAVLQQWEFLPEGRLSVLDTLKLGFPLEQGKPIDRKAFSIACCRHKLNSKLGFSLVEGRPTDWKEHSVACRLKLNSDQDVQEQNPTTGGDGEGEQMTRVAGQVACWVVTAIYVGWLFLLPYAPGDPVWAITPSTIQMLMDLSLNFFFVLPLTSMLANTGQITSPLLHMNGYMHPGMYLSNGSLKVMTLNWKKELDMAIRVTFWCRAAGFHGLMAPVVHPTAEALFNFVIGWTLLFAPLLFTDKKRSRFGGSLETLWIIQMFLTNTVLAPYMAIRESNLPAVEEETSSSEQNIPLCSLKSLSRGMISRADIVGLTGALVGILSLLWAFIGRPVAEFGGIPERWDYLLNYVASERLAYAFLWDIALYSVFQPWLIGDNLENVTLEMRRSVRILRFVPYLGLVLYIFGLQREKRLEL